MAEFDGKIAATPTPPIPDPAPLLAALDAIPSARILVVGDLILDRFIFGVSSRVSREAPVVVLKHDRTLEVPGGGANTAMNAHTIGAQVQVAGVIGESDEAGAGLQAAFEKGGIAASRQYLIAEPGWRTTSKMRVLGGLRHSTMQQLARVDDETPLPADPASPAVQARRAQLIATLTKAWPTLDGVILSDYGLGVIEPELVVAVRELQAARPIPVTVDSHLVPLHFHGLTSMTPNVGEVEETLGDPRLSDDVARLEREGEKLRGDRGLTALLVTRGKFGMTLFGPADQPFAATTDRSAAEPYGAPLHIGVFGSDQVADVTGAGDTVIATYTSALAAGATFETAARLANIAGGLVVMKRGTATVTPSEIREAIQAATS